MGRQVIDLKSPGRDRPPVVHVPIDPSAPDPAARAVIGMRAMTHVRPDVEATDFLAIVPGRTGGLLDVPQSMEYVCGR